MSDSGERWDWLIGVTHHVTDVYEGECFHREPSECWTPPVNGSDFCEPTEILSDDGDTYEYKFCKIPETEILTCVTNENGFDEKSEESDDTVSPAQQTEEELPTSVYAADQLDRKNYEVQETDDDGEPASEYTDDVPGSSVECKPSCVDGRQRKVDKSRYDKPELDCTLPVEPEISIPSDILLDDSISDIAQLAQNLGSNMQSNGKDDDNILVGKRSVAFRSARANRGAQARIRYSLKSHKNNMMAELEYGRIGKIWQNNQNNMLKPTRQAPRMANGGRNICLLLALLHGIGNIDEFLKITVWFIVMSIAKERSLKPDSLDFAKKSMKTNTTRVIDSSVISELSDRCKSMSVYMVKAVDNAGYSGRTSEIQQKPICQVDDVEDVSVSDQVGDVEDVSVSDQVDDVEDDTESDQVDSGDRVHDTTIPPDANENDNSCNIQHIESIESSNKSIFENGQGQILVPVSTLADDSPEDESDGAITADGKEGIFYMDKYGCLIMRKVERNRASVTSHVKYNIRSPEKDVENSSDSMALQSGCGNREYSVTESRMLGARMDERDTAVTTPGHIKSLTRDQKQPYPPSAGNILIGSVELRRGVCYFTNAKYVFTFLEMRKSEKVQGLLRDWRLHNMTIEDGMVKDVKNARILHEDDAGKVIMYQACGEIDFCFIMVERKSNYFREDEVMFCAKFEGKVRIVPKLLGILENGGYVRMMFECTKDCDLLSNLLEAGDMRLGTRRILRFLDHVFRGVEKLHKHGVILGGVCASNILLDPSCDSFSLLPLMSVTVDNWDEEEASVHLHDDSNSTRKAKARADDIQSIGFVVMEWILGRPIHQQERIQAAPHEDVPIRCCSDDQEAPCITRLLLQMLEPRWKRRITASGGRQHPALDQPHGGLWMSSGNTDYSACLCAIITAGTEEIHDGVQVESRDGDSN